MKKKLLYFMTISSILLCLGAMAGLGMNSWNAYKNMGIISKDFFPLLEMSAINVRLQSQIDTQLENAKTNNWQKDEVHEYKNLSQTLNYNLTNYNKLVDKINKTKAFKEPLEKINSNVLKKYNEEIYQYLASDRIKKAQRILNAGDFLKERESFSLKLSQVTEDTLAKRDKILAGFRDTLLQSLIVSSIIISFSVFVLVLIFRINKQMSERARKAEKELEEERIKSFHSAKLTALGEMAGGIAHEINNPLAIVSNIGSRLRLLVKNEKYNKENLTNIANKLDKTVDRMAKIISIMRQLSRDEKEQALEPIPVKSLFGDVLELCQGNIKKHSVDLQINEHNSEAHICCSQVEISQILLNLINNSIYALKDLDEKWIVLSTEVEKEEVVLRVRDSGLNIYEKLHEKVMNPFFTTKPPGEGTGLGLSISKKIVESYNGSLEMNPNTATTEFIIRLPAYEAKSQAA